jgi:hypothetical protein
MFVVACGDDDEAEEDITDITPVGTKDATPTPAATDSGAGGPPAPAEPSLDEELTEISRGDLEATIGPGGSYAIDPEALAAEAGAEDVCSNFQFDFSWQVTEPYPPDGTALSWKYEGGSGQVQVASGPAGNQAVGCGLISAVNEGPGPITVAVKYAMGALQ